MAETEQELREVIEAQEIVIRAGADLLAITRAELDAERRMRESLQKLYDLSRSGKRKA